MSYHFNQIKYYNYQNLGHYTSTCLKPLKNKSGLSNLYAITETSIKAISVGIITPTTTF